MCFAWELKDFRSLRVGCGLQAFSRKPSLELTALANAVEPRFNKPL